MISDKTRKTIANATLFFVLLSIISAFAGNVGNDIIGIISLSVDLLSLVCIIWLAYGLRMLYLEEHTKELKYSFIIVGGAAILEIIGSILYLIANIAFSNVKIFIQSAEAVLSASFITFIAGFWFLKIQLDAFARERRNLFKGQISLPLGYLFRTIFTILIIFKPLNELLVKNQAGKLEILPGWKNYFIAISFFQITYVFLIIIGYWNLRRTILVLDRVPLSYLQTIAKPAPVQSTVNINYQYPTKPLERRTDEKAEHDETTIEEKATTTEPKKKKMFCIKCGLELEPDAQYCPNCGTKNPYIEQ